MGTGHTIFLYGVSPSIVGIATELEHWEPPHVVRIRATGDETEERAHVLQADILISEFDDEENAFVMEMYRQFPRLSLIGLRPSDTTIMLQFNQRVEIATMHHITAAVQRTIRSQYLQRQHIANELTGSPTQKAKY